MKRSVEVLVGVLNTTGSNCGIGSGGFQPGNKCAKGGKASASQSKKIKKGSIVHYKGKEWTVKATIPGMVTTLGRVVPRAFRLVGKNGREEFADEHELNHGTQSATEEKKPLSTQEKITESRKLGRKGNWTKFMDQHERLFDAVDDLRSRGERKATSEAEYFYSNTGDRVVNDALRSGAKIGKINRKLSVSDLDQEQGDFERVEDYTKDQVNGLSETLQKEALRPLAEETVVYRGVGDNVLKSLRLTPRTKPGLEIEAVGFSSTSLDPNVSEGFARAGKLPRSKELSTMRIIAKRGLPIVSGYNGSEESEIVQAHGTRYRLFMVSQERLTKSKVKFRVYTLEEV